MPSFERKLDNELFTGDFLMENGKENFRGAIFQERTMRKIFCEDFSREKKKRKKIPGKDGLFFLDNFSRKNFGGNFSGENEKKKKKFTGNFHKGNWERTVRKIFSGRFF